jgi:murein DD-endopeptidase MepM/ murein hydrolase activator NlpD
VIVLEKKSGKRHTGWFSSPNLLKTRKLFKSHIQKFVANVKPYFALKYWPVYLLSFGLGLYLWGPSHGWRKLYNWKIKAESHTPQNLSVVTLRRELNRLKHQLQIEQLKKVEPVFDPHSFSRPALGQVVQGFEWTDSEKSWRLHPGVDISLPLNSNIIAAAAGTISKVKKTADGGFSVTINHGSGWESVYSDLADVQVQEGQTVLKGIIIGTSGPSGIHSKTLGFHFGIYQDQEPVNPRNIIDGL